MRAKLPAKRNQRGRIPKNADTRFDTDLSYRFREWLTTIPDSPRNAYLKDMCFSKFVGAETDPADVRRVRAINKWLATEANNRSTNERLMTTSPEYKISGVAFERFVGWTRDFVSRVLGDTVPLDALIGSFSGGASTSRIRSQGHPALKFVGAADITESAKYWYECVIDECPLWSSVCEQPLRVVDASVLFTVPKNSLIDRVCCKEPDINMFLQKGVGQYIRRRLRSFNINLNDQTRNQRLAREGSITGSLATLDLSSASDSISDELVSLLLPLNWYACLDDLRSKSVWVDGEKHSCEMFSSMGNGFTFELESLLFFSLAKAVAYFTGTRGTISVYGDDIIVPTGMYERLVEVLSYFGFEVNAEKSFSIGPFRESCGGHYYNGHDITPFFIRGPIMSLTDLVHALNQLRLWASRDQGVFLNEDAWDIWSSLSQLVPRKFWGGDRDSSGRYQLISPGYPRKRLSPAKSSFNVPQEGLYLQTMLQLSRRIGPAQDESPEPSVVHSFYRVKPAKRWDWHDSGNVFLAELT